MSLRPFSELRVAFITDSMTAFGGADRELIALLKLFPNSVIFTSVYNKKAYNITNEVRISFLQKIPILRRHLSFLTPLAFEQFDLKGYDLVVSLSAGPAKGVVTRVYQPHIGIILTPPRHQWDREINARGSILFRIYQLGSFFISHYLRLWDSIAIKRVDHFITISKYIQSKVKHVYNQDSEVIYPGVSEYWFEKPTSKELSAVKDKYRLPDDFILSVGRLYDHKRVDWAIKACMENKQHLCIIGSGPDEKFLRKMSKGSEYIHFLGHIPDDEMRATHALSEAFVFPAVEDFGYVTVEAQAQGKPALVCAEGGSKEIVVNGKTGATFRTMDELNDLVSKKIWKRYNSKDIVLQARKFSETKFLSSIEKFVRKIL
ncbi:glycosyltransferase [bacterium]|nr:glycosyltransferase [bacterium]